MMTQSGQHDSGNNATDIDRGRAATEKALAEFGAATIPDPEVRRKSARTAIRLSLVKLLFGAVLGSGLGWLYWVTESRWAFFGAAVLGVGPFLGALRRLYTAVRELKAATGVS